jgi:hypothetical protein
MSIVLRHLGFCPVCQRDIKVTVRYHDAVDLLQQALGEGGLEP